MLVVVLATIALGGYLGWSHFSGHGRDTAAVDGAKGGGQAPAVVPVTIYDVQLTDFPVYFYGLGTVEPYDTVTVSSRVDGEVTMVAFKQGQMVMDGDILARIDPRPYQAALDDALGKKAQHEASLKDARLMLGRLKTLLGESAVTPQQVDTQTSVVDQLVAQIKSDDAVIDNAQTQIGYTTIRAPISGKTGFRLVDPGNIVHAADTAGIVTIVKLQPISVVFTATENDVPQINTALAAGSVRVDALSWDGLKTLSQGKLSVVNNEIDQASGTIRMKATFENSDNALWPGLSVSTRVLVDTLKQVAVIPEDAVQRGPNGLFTYVVTNDNKAEIHVIKVGQEDNGQAVVLQGLVPGQKVVTSGQYRLQQGALVQPSEASSPTTPEKTGLNEPVKTP